MVTPVFTAEQRSRAVSGFTLYDVANSAFVTTVVTAVGGPFLTALAEDAAGDDGRLAVLGLDLRVGGLFAFATSLSVLLQVLALPLLGAMADRAHGKRALLVRGTAVGVVATLGLAVTPGPLVGLALFSVANVALGVAILAYNAYLADVAEPQDLDAVSARGFAAGYAGGGLVLALALALLTFAEPLGISRGTAVRIAIAGSGVWWAVLGVVAVRRLDAVRRHDDDEGPLRVRAAVEGLRSSLRALRGLPLTARYLLSFLLFNDAIQAVVGLSTVVLTQELFVGQGRDADDATGFLLSLVLLIQVVAVGGALGCARLAARYGAKRVLLGTLVLWSLVLLYAVLGLETTTQAYAMGVVIALVLGGSQALARSLFSGMVPAERQSSFFGFYELAERGTA
ncbi:MAG: major facilitator superfamily 1, partial [Frankiales bacterium]|nr:major facilitator superfamily 1 [Frankiales bacterium]